jgi:hypothetical protein
MEKTRPGYSADVQMFLHVGDHRLDVAQAAVDTCFLREPIDHPPCEADLVLLVDGRESTWHVRLPLGISRTSRCVQFE